MRLFLALLLLLPACSSPGPHQWSAKEKSSIASMSIERLGDPPADPSNALADDPDAADFGQRLFFDEALSANGKVSCATCHKADRMFEDGLPLAEAIGTTARHTPSIVGTSWSPWFFWDGRKDSQWSQAMGPLETDVEHGTNRMAVVRHLVSAYPEAFAGLAGNLPDVSDRSRFPNAATPVGTEEEIAAWEAMHPEDRETVNHAFAVALKSIAAYERLIRPGHSRFDTYAAAVAKNDPEALADTFNESEAHGLRLFIGRANCTECHHGPRLTNDDFHNIGLSQPPNTRYDNGRIGGAEQVIADPFNCTGLYSDAGPHDCDELRFIKPRGIELMGAFKVPSLRNVAETAPYMQDGSLPNLTAVLLHYNQAPVPLTGHSDLKPLDLSGEEFDALEAFLRTLSAPLDVAPERLRPLE